MIYFDLPLPSSGGGTSVDVDVDLVALVGGRDPHMLTGVVAADNRRRHRVRRAHRQGVDGAVAHEGTVSDGRRGGDCGRALQHQRVEVNPNHGIIGKSEKSEKEKYFYGKAYFSQNDQQASLDTGVYRRPSPSCRMCRCRGRRLRTRCRRT